MTDQEIKPRFNCGVGWCDAGCPQCRELQPNNEIRCRITGGLYIQHFQTCPIWASRMAAWAEEARTNLREFPSTTGNILLSSYPAKDGK